MFRRALWQAGTAGFRCPARTCHIPRLDFDLAAKSVDGGLADGPGVHQRIATDEDGAENGQPAGQGLADGLLCDLYADAPQELLDDPQAGLLDDDPFTDPRHHIAHQHGRTVAEQAIDHHLPVELRRLAEAGGHIGDHLLLDFPDPVQIGDA